MEELVQQIKAKLRARDIEILRTNKDTDGFFQIEFRENHPLFNEKRIACFRYNKLLTIF